MSEMTMFNVERSSLTDSTALYTDFGVGIGFESSGPLEKKFDQKNEQDYEGVEDNHAEGISLNMYAINEDEFGFGFSLGIASGVDVTAKIRKDYYVTLQFTGNYTANAFFQKRLFVDEMKGMSFGFYIGKANQPYYSNMGGFTISPDESTNLYHFGLRSRMMYRNSFRKGSGFIGTLNAGYIPEIGEPYFGFSVGYLTF
jgi:hypothetical protein